MTHWHKEWEKEHWCMWNTLPQSSPCSWSPATWVSLAASIEYIYSLKKLLHGSFFLFFLYFFFLLLYVSLFQKRGCIKKQKSKNTYILCKQLMPYEQSAGWWKWESIFFLSHTYSKLITFQAHPQRVKQHLSVL